MQDMIYKLERIKKEDLAMENFLDRVRSSLPSPEDHLRKGEAAADPCSVLPQHGRMKQSIAAISKCPKRKLLLENRNNKETSLFVAANQASEPNAFEKREIHAKRLYAPNPPDAEHFMKESHPKMLLYSESSTSIKSSTSFSVITTLKSST